MVEIVKRPRERYYFTCPFCDTSFIADKHDVDNSVGFSWLQGKRYTATHYASIDCPECGKKVSEKKVVAKVNYLRYKAEH